ncbi:TPA: DUF6119 family protein, partial [Legionella pneumophila]
MAKFNIFRLKKETERNLLDKFRSVGLMLCNKKEIDGFTLTLFISKNPKQVDIWWVDLYDEYLDVIEDKPKNKVYFGVFLISNESLLYAVSMGKSHFYLKEFCDLDFGINMAERIADNSNLKLKNSKLFGSKRNKSIISYQNNSEFEYDSGESIHFLKSESIDKNIWGKMVSFGNSIQIELDITPDKLPDIVLNIESELKKDPRIILPRANKVEDIKKIGELDIKLVREILTDSDADLQATETTLSGVDFIFLDKSEYSFLYNRKLHSMPELSIEILREFVRKNAINLEDDINKIKIKTADENNKGFTSPLKNFIDYIDGDRFFLLDGKWYQFNQNYLSFLQHQIDNLIQFERSPVDFSKSDYDKWLVQIKSTVGQTLTYPEYYFNTMQVKDGYLNFDRDTETLKKYKIEKMDLYKDDTAYFVKIGTPQKLGYVVDQAITTIKTLQNKAISIEVKGHNISPKNICLWLILDRSTMLTKISEINSLIFLIK